MFRVFGTSAACLLECISARLSLCLSVCPQVIRITRIVKFVRVLRLVRLLKLRRLSVKIYEQVSSRVMTLIISLVKLFFMIFMIAHWSGCLFFLIGDAQGEGEDPDVPVSWVEADGIREASIGVQYVASLYWALTTLTTVGYGDITPVSIDERLYTMVIELLAAALFGMVVSNMASLLAVFNQQQTLKNEQLVEATAFLKKKGVPRELMLRVRRFLEFVFSNERQTTADGSRFMEHLTESLRDEVHYHLVERTLRGFPLFGDGSHHQLVRLARICTTVMLAPGDVLVQEGGVGDAMYFVVKGTLKRSARGKDKIPPVTEGQWFGQETLFADWVWPWTVRCMAFCEIVRIHHEDFQELIRTFPALEKRYFDVQDMLEQGDWSVIQRECPWCKNPDHYNDNCPVYVKGAQAPDDLEETLSQVPLEELHGGEEGGKGRVKHLIIRSRKLMERVFVVPSRLKAYKPKRVPRAPSSRSLRSKRTGGDTAERGAMAERRTLSRIPSGGSVNGVVEGENDRGGMCEGTRCCCGARRSGERGRLEDEEEERIEQVGEGGGGGRLPSGRLASSVASSALSLGGREREPKRLNTSSKALTKRPKRGRSISFMFNGSRDLQAQRFASTPAPVVGQSAADAAASVAAAGADTREATASTMVQSVNTERERASDRERVGEGGGERDRRIGGVGVGPTTGGFSSRNARAQTLSG
uniref:Cyclic nucleotide-binding domain-containing protein n=1 Tax=Chromera velia CCMP2878 TaxID=1169474 RepID=A0A0G4HCZ9_9ALVE|eukprot:Cvel_26214.t1-p1 / transcript=Cvel_26214.t1 / gene=Cvel_26214 / organism=Chromera_velia_CCMP2878 / gene_product=Potassium/sodium hyperpolarization-activated cyclic, putative / transcript_product=Potassium/sodium hyperpolarization-activated cyclic, putative / location=Cvel_scaffold3088:255-5650(+) / protein_length=699 / sequence_SO=supercontig / SO=protein_coding / is_pseudo=false